MVYLQKTTTLLVEQQNSNLIADSVKTIRFKTLIMKKIILVFISVICIFSCKSTKKITSEISSYKDSSITIDSSYRVSDNSEDFFNQSDINEGEDISIISFVDTGKGVYVYEFNGKEIKTSFPIKEIKTSSKTKTDNSKSSNLKKSVSEETVIINQNKDISKGKKVDSEESTSKMSFGNIFTLFLILVIVTILLIYIKERL